MLAIAAVRRRIASSTENWLVQRGKMNKKNTAGDVIVLIEQTESGKVHDPLETIEAYFALRAA